MLLRLSNRLPMELPDLFSIPLPNEGPHGTGWCLVTVMDSWIRARLTSMDARSIELLYATATTAPAL
jgi:hypothetical protein